MAIDENIVTFEIPVDDWIGLLRVQIFYTFEDLKAPSFEHLELQITDPFEMPSKKEITV